MKNRKSIGDKRKFASLVSKEVNKDADLEEVSINTILRIFEGIEDASVEALNSGFDVVIPGKVKLSMKTRKAIPSRQNKHPRNGTLTTFKETPARLVLKAKVLNSVKDKVEYDIDKK